MQIEIGRVKSIEVSPAVPAIYGGGFTREIHVVYDKGAETTITLRSRTPADLALEDGMAVGVGA